MSACTQSESVFHPNSAVFLYKLEGFDKLSCVAGIVSCSKAE